MKFSRAIHFVAVMGLTIIGASLAEPSQDITTGNLSVRDENIELKKRKTHCSELGDKKHSVTKCCSSSTDCTTLTDDSYFDKDWYMPWWEQLQGYCKGTYGSDNIGVCCKPDNWDDPSNWKEPWECLVLGA